ncbi:YaeQ family protein [Thiomicrospira sp. ALE5]|uniref:YaeQ family protein n=1 Tax=Thiomicrospira sp. ALE5 TaxID=748650 RepID=UPI0008E7D882|nr:YaeQ family protein [Thiomicrospira sp. ALE5]SFR58795.1 Uncharacterized conserved protein YaeQ, suppresses RfaH defect [Thiomicrospira sp. ALE5]
MALKPTIYKFNIALSDMNRHLYQTLNLTLAQHPSENLERIKKASRLARTTKIYSFNSKSDVWWSQNQTKLQSLKVDIIRFNWDEVQALAKRISRTMDFSISLTGDSAYIATDSGDCECHWTQLQEVSR